MPVKQINTELGHSVPPEAPHNITFHIPGWDTALAVRRGDKELLSKFTSIYPRFSPWAEVRQLSTHLHTLLSFPPTHAALPFTHPDALAAARAYATDSAHRKPEHLIPPEELLFRAVDIPLTLPLPSEPDAALGATERDAEGKGKGNGNGQVVRLYVVGYPADGRAPGVVGVWQNYGIGVSSRLAAALVPALERGDGGVKVVEWGKDGTDGELVVPGSDGGSVALPLGEAHQGLRRRIAELVIGEGGKGPVDGSDVFLYPTGMAAIYRAHKAFVQARGGGKVVVLGSVFHNSFHVFEECEGGMKHFGRCDADSGVIEALEEFLEGEKAAGRKVAYAFAEFPSNPILVSLDLKRLREVADKYDVPVVIDDTIGSFCNIDVTRVADVIMTSTTKSLSGYANVMGGSIALLPSSPHYASFKSAFVAQFHNEYFHADAARLLANAADYHARSAILNRNALTLARFLHEHSQTANSPITAVLYPPFTDTHANYLALMRAPYTTPTTSTTLSSPTPSTTSDEATTFHPGYGCLLSLSFPTIPVARAFYDNLSVYQGPHLGAHQTLAFPFNDAIWGVDASAAAYAASFGAAPEQVRVSVGLESEEELVDTFEAALRVAEGVWREERTRVEAEKA